MPNGLILLGCMAGSGLSYLILIRLMPFLDAFDVEFLEHTLGGRRVPGLRAWTRRVRRG